MPLIQNLPPTEQQKAVERILQAFILWCQQEFSFHLYPYQKRVARAILEALYITREDVAIAISRQAGKTECLTLLIRFLIIFHRLFTGSPLMCGFASPKGEQAKTSIDRIKLSVQKLGERWQVEDREFNAATVRAFRFDNLHAEIFRFSLAPSSAPHESKTLNFLIVDEAHEADDKKRSKELDPMLASTGGITVFIGVGCARVCDFQRAKNGQQVGCKAVVVPVDEVIRDRRQAYEETGDTKHLEYEKAFARELRKKGKENPEIRRNYYLEDTVEAGNFVSRERLLSCSRPSSKVIPLETLYAGIDWARKSDYTWLTIVNDQNDVVDWFKYPHVSYPDQVQMIKDDMAKDRGGWSYKQRITGLFGDSTGGTGDAPMEILAEKSGLPVGEDSHFVFTTQSKNALYLHFEELLFKDVPAFSYPADHPLAAEFEEQMCRLVREYLRDGEYLSVHHPPEPEAKDDAPDATALALLAGKRHFLGDILIL